MSVLQPLEKSLAEALKGVPALPPGAKKALVEFVPWINLVFGLLALASVYWLWQWAHVANNAINYLNNLSVTYGGGQVVSNRLGFTVWLALAVLTVQAVIILAAILPLKDRKKSGWDLLFYALILQVVYGVVVAFTAYGIGHLFSSLIGVAIGLYFLFQIRDAYLKQPAANKKV